MLLNVASNASKNSKEDEKNTQAKAIYNVNLKLMPNKKKTKEILKKADKNPYVKINTKSNKPVKEIITYLIEKQF